MAKLSGLQRDVLKLYRQCIRAVRLKPDDTRENFRAFAREEFRKNVAMDKKDFGTIEYLLRRGRRQLEIYQDEGIRNIAR
ncbi:complex 1 protein-domain-containing protein [Clohesyomyces aquaticus]|uniref:Complex 1 protein-domain-containing protein n=1 Tax=Clohesyomyces aquaticus TaxID=1231657 RepID=A0A1Y1ZN67_9PLEO|nr:complex 1 protein-domain-containing protein [Clohesyomyces aquaticus]